MAADDSSSAKFEFRIEDFPKFVKNKYKKCSECKNIGQFICSLTASAKYVQNSGRTCLFVKLNQSKKAICASEGNFVVATVCLKSRAKTTSPKIKMVEGSYQTLGFVEPILEPSNGYLTGDQAIVLDVEFVDNKNRATNEISLVVPDVVEWTSFPFTASKLKSGDIELANAKWYLLASITKEQGKPAAVSLYLHCSPVQATSADWSCVCSANFFVKSSKDTKVTRSIFNMFNNKANRVGFPSFINTKVLLRESNGYKTKEGSVEFIVQLIRVEPLTIELDPIAQTFFTDLEGQIPLNGTLLINNCQVKVNKELLAEYSPFFKSLFFSDFQEKTMSEIPVEDVEENEFKELLWVLYPRYRPVIERNVKFLLRLGDRFQIDCVMNACERYLLASWSSKKYKDMDSCLANTSNADELLALIEDPQTWTDLTESTKKHVRKMLQLAPNTTTSA
ncbi:BTB/POZ domain-containing protein [Ditylenchus destructor]|uniref:BTB/POZ domain-containing protein n=1 Tax=Ditylenchus destructor TaxID=166010 RepID=A0AAD4N3Y3_9BILA|nr:BTB/POZ domain-containing protein [Ditylenchus destructor]